MRKRIVAVVLGLLAATLVGTAATAHPGNSAEAQAYQELQINNENRGSRYIADKCVDGEAAGFECHNIDLVAHISLEELGSVFINDMWGWTDPATGKDYALLGGAEGMWVIDVADPSSPWIVGHLPTWTTAGGDSWRDIKVYENHAFVGSENTGHGIQVLDLTQVRAISPSDAPVTFTETARYAGVGNSHNIHVNEATGHLYIVGATSSVSGQLPNLVVIDAPSGAAGSYQADGAGFGPPPDATGVSGDVVLVNDASADPTQGCDPLVGFPAGSVALVDRGSCPFTQKASNAQAAGATAVIVANNSGTGTITMGGSDSSIVIPAVMVSLDDGNAIKAGLPATGTVSSNPAADPCENGGLHIVDVNDPANPTSAGCVADNGYVHDTQCVIYEGPDAEHRGQEICFNSTPDGADSVSIVDVTDKDNTVVLSETEYPTAGYSHQGWLSPKHDYFLHGDELDETGQGINTRTRVWDVRDLDNPVLVNEFTNGNTSIDHNLYTEGRISYHSNYTSGLRIFSNADAINGNLEEIAFFDMYPENDNPSFEGGTWSNYPYFRDKTLVGVSSIDRGFFLLRTRLAGGAD